MRRCQRDGAKSGTEPERLQRAHFSAGVIDPIRRLGDFYMAMEIWLWFRRRAVLTLSAAVVLASGCGKHPSPISGPPDAGVGGTMSTTACAAGGTFGASGAGGAGGVWQYSNPVMKGDWSDPAVVRVGEDYYSVRSTFGWQPGLAIAHSKDLVHWQYIGNAFSSFPSIATGEVANGIWGSEMIFNSNTSMFMIYATYNGMPLQVFESAKPEGPYTQLPGGLDAGGGYDPGVFIDDDGRVYLVSSTGKIVELAADGKSVVNPSVSSYAGWNEGPELFKRAPYYYVTWSSNGTERGANGIINSARSMSLAGPWQPDPTNPVLQNLNRGTDPNHPFEGPQHSELIQTQNGEWFVTFHTWEWNYGTLAREMCLEPVVWTDDGWWRPKNGKQPSLTNDGPNLPFTPYEPQRSDDFSTATLGPQWFFHTTPDWSGASWSLTDHPGFLRIKTRAGDVNGAAAYQGMPMQRIDLKAVRCGDRRHLRSRGWRRGGGDRLALDAGVQRDVLADPHRRRQQGHRARAVHRDEPHRRTARNAHDAERGALRRYVGPPQGQLRRQGERDLLLQRRRLQLARPGRAGRRGSGKRRRLELARASLERRHDRALRGQERRID